MVLVDLNPFSLLTDPLLYTWEELEAWHGAVELRLVDASCIQPSQHQAFRLPKVRKDAIMRFLISFLEKDIIDLSTGEDIHKFVDLFQSVRALSLDKQNFTCMIFVTLQNSLDKS